MNFGHFSVGKLEGTVSVMSFVRDLLKGWVFVGGISQSEEPGILVFVSFVLLGGVLGWTGLL